MIENGLLKLSTAAGWLAEYLHELTVFPNRGKHDDQVDFNGTNAGLAQAGRPRAGRNL
jgi:phage terminase large subunit-like protein